MDSIVLIYATAALILGAIALNLFRRAFDPFAPHWMFLIGYFQVYVIQAISYREWALRVRGEALVAQADLRTFWALLLFLVVYGSGLGRRLAGWLPRPPASWSPVPVYGLAPILIVLGLLAAAWGSSFGMMSEAENLLRSFPLMMQVAGVLLLVTGRNAARPRPAATAAGLTIVVLYTLIWIFNGKRSPALIAVLTGLAAFYIPRFRRPSKPVLVVAAFSGALVVALAIGWRGNTRYERSAAGFVNYLAEFDVSSVLVSLNLRDREGADPITSATFTYETEEYGGFLLMLDTVPEKSGYDFGAPYLRVFTTFIPRMFWPDKPLFREAWVAAWIAGSEFPRDATFTGPAIGILGATQLNGGATGTAIVLGLIALGLSTAFAYFRRYQAVPWVQAWWSLTFVNAWLMVANDDPLVWFYYIYGFTMIPPLAILWIANRGGGKAVAWAIPDAPALSGWSPRFASTWEVPGGGTFRASDEGASRPVTEPPEAVRDGGDLGIRQPSARGPVLESPRVPFVRQEAHTPWTSLSASPTSDPIIEQGSGPWAGP